MLQQLKILWNFRQHIVNYLKNEVSRFYREMVVLCCSKTNNRFFCYHKMKGIFISCIKSIRFLRRKHNYSNVHILYLFFTRGHPCKLGSDSAWLNFSDPMRIGIYNIIYMLLLRLNVWHNTTTKDYFQFSSLASCKYAS